MAYWIASGIVGALVRDAWSYFAKHVGLAKFYIWNIGASLFVGSKEVTSVWGTVLGLLTDCVIGGMFGVVLGLLLEWRGTKHYALKGLSVGLAAWLFFYGLLYHNLPYSKSVAPSDPLSNLSAFIGHTIFGLTMAVVYMKIFYKREETSA